eukprot:190529-Chlamydomonas_euryale.AAC.1
MALGCCCCRCCRRRGGSSQARPLRCAQLPPKSRCCGFGLAGPHSRKSRRCSPPTCTSAWE